MALAGTTSAAACMGKDHRHHYFGTVSVKGRRRLQWGTNGQPLHRRRREQHRHLLQSHRKGDTANSTVPESVRSNLTTILGRTAAYQGREVTWKEMMERREIEFDLKSLKA